MPYQRGEARPTAKLTEQQVREIWEAWHRAYTGLERRPTMAMIAEHYGVSAPNIHHIVHGTRWGHTTRQLADKGQAA